MRQLPRVSAHDCIVLAQATIGAKARPMHRGVGRDFCTQKTDRRAILMQWHQCVARPAPLWEAWRRGRTGPRARPSLAQTERLSAASMCELDSSVQVAAGPSAHAHIQVLRRDRQRGLIRTELHAERSAPLSRSSRAKSGIPTLHA